MRILFFGTFDEDMHPRVQVLRDGLAAHGHEIVVVNAPLGVSTSRRVALAAQPWRHPGFVARLARCWLRLLWRSRRTHPDVVVVGYLGHFDIHLARLRFPRTTIVLDHLVSLAATMRDRDLDSAGFTERLMESADRSALGRADVVLVDTNEQLDALPANARRQAIEVPVGATRDWARNRRPILSAEPRLPLRVVFFGLYTPLQGAPVIGEAIALLDKADAPVQWTMAGHGQDLDATKRAAGPNAPVRWVDWMTSEELRASVADHDVCLGIFGTTEKAMRVVPNKVYQGATAGCAIVTSDTPPQRRMLAEAAVYVEPGNPEALADVIRELAQNPEHLAAARRAAALRADNAFTPAEVVGPLCSRLEPPPSSHSIPPLALNAWLRWDSIEAQLDRLPAPETILEIGAGQGAAGARLARLGAYVGIEPDAQSRAVARSRLPTDAALLGSADDLDATQQFDLVCAFEVIEHIEDDFEALCTWSERVRPGGHLLLSTPADPDRMGAWDRRVGHYRRYSRAGIDALFANAGLETVAIDAVGYPLGMVLEHIRNSIARVDQWRSGGASNAERTAASGRAYQPPAVAGTLMQATSAPFRRWQRRATDSNRATCWVAVARRPLR